jgi:hypothetical protein
MPSRGSHGQGFFLTVGFSVRAFSRTGFSAKPGSLLLERLYSEATNGRT